MAFGPEEGLLCTVLDSVMALAPRAWATVRLEVVPGRSGLQLAALESKGEGQNEPPPSPTLGLDKREEARRLGEGLTELQSLIAAKGKRWAGGALELKRSPGHVELKAVDPQGGVTWLNRLGPEVLDLQLFSEPLFDALVGTERAFSSLQAGFESRVGSLIGWSLDGRTLTLERDAGPLTLPVLRLGEWDGEAFLWRWGWSLEESPRLRRWCAPDAQAPGLSAFWRPELMCDLGVAFALAAHAVVSLGGRGLFRADHGHEVALLAVDVPP